MEEEAVSGLEEQEVPRSYSQDVLVALLLIWLCALSGIHIEAITFHAWTGTSSGVHLFVNVRNLPQSNGMSGRSRRRRTLPTVTSNCSFGTSAS